jgi:hypothetical protein
LSQDPPKKPGPKDEVRASALGLLLSGTLSFKIPNSGSTASNYPEWDCLPQKAQNAQFPEALRRRIHSGIGAEER